MLMSCASVLLLQSWLQSSLTTTSRGMINLRCAMAGVHYNSSEYSHRLQLGEDSTNVQKIVHSLQDGSSAAAKAEMTRSWLK